jgi:YD repeat-containing protein
MDFRIIEIKHMCFKSSIRGSLLLSLGLLFNGFGALAQPTDNSMVYNKSAQANGNSDFLKASPQIAPSLYTGGLKITLPIYTLKGSDLQVPISVAYTATNGVRPTDPNTAVGMDWKLMAGGSITRTVRGLPDEMPYGYTGTHLEGNVVVNDYNSPNGSTTQGFNNTFNLGASSPVVDGEPDIFVITTPSFSAQFTLDQNGNPVFQDNTGLQVTHQLYNNSGNPEGYGITVIDAQGTQYVFGSQGTAREMTTTKFFGTSMQYNSTWYLEKIVTLNGKDEIDFTYQSFQDETLSSYQLLKQFTSNWPSSPWPSTADPTSYSNVTVLFLSEGDFTYNGPKFIQTISSKSGEADFSYGSNVNSLLNSTTPPPLTSITIKAYNPSAGGNTTTLQTYGLAYSDLLTNGLTSTDQTSTDWYQNYRRRLSSISVAGNTTGTSTPLTLYSFQYYEGTLVGRETPNLWDYWGYQNLSSNNFWTDGNNSDQNYFLSPDATRQPASFTPTGASQAIPMADVYALKEIDQLGGASTVFNYQQNDYYNGSANVVAGGSRVSSIVKNLPTGESLPTTYSYYDASGHSTGQIWSDLFKHVRLYYDGGPCCGLTTTSMSQSPYGISDDNGVLVGYSSVKVTDPNLGYTVNTFSNFSDYPDVISIPPPFASLNYSSTYSASVSLQLSSFSYKRGLPLTKTVYTASGAPVSQDANTFGSLDGQPTVGVIGIQDMTWYTHTPEYWGVNIYHSNIENWRLTQTVHTDYDQKSSSRLLQTTTAYTYAPDKRQIRSVSKADSKGQTDLVTYYYSNDAGIPLVTTSEQNVLSVLASPAVNATSLLIHQVENRNGSTRAKHVVYSSYSSGTGTNYYPATSNVYTGGTLVHQQNLNYDPTKSLLISSNMSGDKSTSSVYDYKSSVPTASIVNASAQVAVSTSQGQQSGAITTIAGSETVTTSYAGPINLSFHVGGVAGTFSVSVSILNLSGGNVVPAQTLCYSTTGGCSNSSYTSPSVAAGTYIIHAEPVGTQTTTGWVVNFSYPYTFVTATPTNEFFYEGFEQSTGTAGSAHTGNMYYNANYVTAFNPPNSRSYIIQWWNLVNGAWVFNQKSYSSGMTLTGPLDDIRIFPSDALMTTYTYNPLVGKTSEINPAGKTKTYEYDGLGRLLHIRDQDGNIIKQYDYEYQVGLQQ